MCSLKSISKTPLALMIGGMLLATGQAVVATDATSTLTPEILLQFTGDDETSSHWGRDPLFPPVPGNDGLLHGVTAYSGVVLNVAVQVGLTYSYNPITGAYAPVSMGDLGNAYSPLLKDEATGTIYGGVRFSNIDFESFAGKGLIYTQDATGASQHAVVPSTQLQPGGQMALDDAGNLYTPVGRTTGACTDSNADTYNNLYRVTPAGEFERLINFCAFREGGTTAATQIQPYGSAAQAYLWSEGEQALYVLMSVATSSSTEGVRPVATLLRLPKATLAKGAANDGSVDAGDFELLHTFSLGNGGLPQGSNVRTSTLLEDGDWIYGTSFYDGYDGSTARGNGNVWRIHKTTGQFAVVHQFRAGAAADITTKTADPADGTDSADGFQPSGPLALGVDGNIYGTTLGDARTYTEVTTGTAANIGRITPTGAGTLFRIKVGTAADRSDDQLEILHRFDVATEGKNPTGVSAGALANGAQAFYGVTRTGEGDTANGTLYSLSVPLSGTGSLTLAAAGSTEVAAGEAVSLSWSNPWYTQGCALLLASGSDSLIDLNADGMHDLANLLALDSLPQGISVTGDLAAGSLSFPLRAAASYQLVCDAPFAGYEGELQSQEVALTLKTASGGGSSGGGSGSGFNVLMLLPLGLLAALRLRRRR